MKTRAGRRRWATSDGAQKRMWMKRLLINAPWYWPYGPDEREKRSGWSIGGTDNAASESLSTGHEVHGTHNRW